MDSDDDEEDSDEDDDEYVFLCRILSVTVHAKIPHISCYSPDTIFVHICTETNLL